MIDIETSKKANELRKKGDLENAIPYYEKLWKSDKDKFAGAGLAFCYRKIKKFDEALKIAEEAYSLFPDFDWCKNEYIWTLIQGFLYNLPVDSELHKIIDAANKILELSPDEIAFKIIIFRVLKAAKKQKNWETLNLWITKLEPNILTGYTDESTGWTDKELWYYYKINGLIYTKNEDEAIKIIENNKSEFYKKIMYFNRLKAIALINKKKYNDAKKIYLEILQKQKDWWLLKEYGELLYIIEELEHALCFYIKAALTPPTKLEMKVSLFTDIGDLFVKLNNNNYALPHYLLSKAIREKNDWGAKDLEEKINLIKKNNLKDLSVKGLMRECETIWKNCLPQNDINNKLKNLEGKISNLNKEKNYCFIVTKDKNSYFCGSRDLPLDVENDTAVKFDIIESFDKKKNQKSYKAINVKIGYKTWN